MSALPTVYEITSDHIKTLEQAGIIPPNTPAAQIQVFGRICQEKGLSAFSEEIYLVGYAGQYSVITGINGFRKIAAETGQLAGMDDPKFDVMPDGSFKTAAQLKQEGKVPTTCTVTAYRLMSGVRCPFTHTALFTEFSTGKNKWQTMPFQMIAKVAEAFALRKGFSDRLTGLQIEEERGAIEDNTIQVEQSNIEDAAREKALHAIDIRLSQARGGLSDRQMKNIEAKTTNPRTTAQELWKIYEGLAQFMPPPDDPAKQFQQMKF